MGKIKGAFKTESGTIIVPEERNSKKGDYVVIYSRVLKRQRGSDAGFSFYHNFFLCSLLCYGLRRSKRKIERIIKELREENNK